MRKKVVLISHANAWRDALTKYQTQPVDIIGSVREEAINHFLEKHFQYDRDRYTFVLERNFNVNGVDRKFKVTIKANSPLIVDLPPFAIVSKDKQLDTLFNTGDWAELEKPNPSAKLMIPATVRRALDPESVRVFCRSLSFEIEWPKLTGGGTWKWTPPPLAVVAEAIVELHQTQDGFILRIKLLRVKFDPIALSAQAAKMLEGLPRRERVAIDACEEKFNDLLVIALNIAGTIYAPKLVHDIHIPVPVLAGKPVAPTLLDMANDIIVVGATVDRAAVANLNQIKLEKTFAAFEGLLQQDIAAAGGFEALMFEDKITRDGSIARVIRPYRAVRAKLVRSTAFVAQLEQQAKIAKRKEKAVLNAAVPGGLGVGANQAVLTRLAKGAMPAPVDRCTDWEPVLPLVRGRVCWWVHIFDPAITIAGVTLSGQVSIDVGGALEACVRSFWDCSWRWECGRLSLAVQGKPGIELKLEHGNGIAFKGKLTGRLVLVSNLPFPFNKVIEAFSGVISDLIMALVNIVASNIKFDILLPEFALPEQKTKLKFSDITPFPFSRTGGTFTPPERTFIGFDVGFTARN